MGRGFFLTAASAAGLWATLAAGGAQATPVATDEARAIRKEAAGKPAPHDPLSAALAAHLSKGPAAADGVGGKLEAVSAVTAFYARRGYRPLWVDAGGPTEAAAAVLALMADAARDGLDPADYLSIAGAADDPADGPPADPAVPVADEGMVRPVSLGPEGPDPAMAALAAREVRLTLAALAYAGDAQAGRVRPSDVSPMITLQPERPDPAGVLAALATSADPADTLRGFHPPHSAFAALRTALGAALDARRTGPVPLPPGPNLRQGMRHPQVAVLRARLGATVFRGTDPTAFGPDLDRAVRAFQEERGLTIDGIVGPRTRAAFEADLPATRVADLLANMERWRWMPRALGPRHVFVNVPAFMVEVRDGGRVTWRGRTIVGRPANPTPMFTDVMDHVVVNPYWHVPYSIARGEMLAGIRRNPHGYLTRRGYDVVRNGRVVSPSSVRWTEANLRRVRIRQRPGPNNALGAVKFMFPNHHAVYLHDTPKKNLFEKDARAFSHGCVRVHRPFDFARALLAGEPGLSGEALEAMAGGKRRRLDLAAPVLVHLAYFTLEAAADGTLVRHADLYGFDVRLRRALGI